MLKCKITRKCGCTGKSARICHPQIEKKLPAVMKSMEQVHERHKLSLLSGCTPRETGSCKLWKSVCKAVSRKRLHGLHSMYPMTLKGISSFGGGEGGRGGRSGSLTNHARDKAC